MAATSEALTQNLLVNLTVPTLKESCEITAWEGSGTDSVSRPPAAAMAAADAPASALAAPATASAAPATAEPSADVKPPTTFLLLLAAAAR
jgi:hypothetical protein